MKKNVLLGLISLLMLFVGCKSLNPYKLYHPKSKVENKLVYLTPTINTSQLPKNYFYKKKTPTDLPLKKIAKPFDYPVGYSGRYMDLSTRYFYYVTEDLNKRTISDNTKGESNVLQANGEMLLTVNKYRKTINPLISVIGTASWMTVLPMLVGVPVGHRKAKLDLQIDIKNMQGDIIKTYNQKFKKQ